MPLPVRASLRAVLAATVLLTAPAAWSANMWFIEDTPLGTNYQCSDWETIEKFADFINNAGYASPIRTPRGRDILAACGQLKSESERLKKHERLALEAMMIAGHGEE